MKIPAKRQLRVPGRRGVPADREEGSSWLQDPGRTGPFARLRGEPGACWLAGGTGDERRGYGPLRATIARILTSEGIPAHPDQVLLTSGSQQALSLVGHLLVRPGDSVVVEDPTYSGAIDLFLSLGADVVGVPMDGGGLSPEAFERAFERRRPKLLYTIPNFHNPTGACLGADRRRTLVELAARHGVPILEDDYVGDLRYDGCDLPALKNFDANGNVIYVRTFSKMLMPGLRTGFVLAQGPVLAHLEAAKRVTDLASSSLIQRTLEAYITVGRYHAQLRKACRVYRRRRDRALAALTATMPPGVRWTPPAGGLFLWLELPDSVNTEELSARAAAEEAVAILPSTRFFVDRRDRPFLRLNFADQCEDRLAEGIARLGRALHRYLQGDR